MSGPVILPGGPDFDGLCRSLAGESPAPFELCLRLEELSLRLRSNSAAVMEDLRGYFAPFAVAHSGPADLEYLFLDGPEAAPPVDLAVRQHLPGKRPDKERFADLAGLQGGGRVTRKQATGMLFFFGQGWNMALGPCAKNRNQLVNFLCARYMERRVAQGWVLGHASGAALASGGPGLALCGFAGMGKSTLALHLVARGLDFVTNDRVLVEPRSGGAWLHGIPKHPRLNPGTALGNPELAPLLSCALPEASRRAYAHLGSEALRGVEDKYDALIDVCFGAVDAQKSDASHAQGALPSRFRLAAPLAGLVVLNWRHGGGKMLARRVDLARRPDLLETFRKPPGVFYLPQALTQARLSPEDCLAALAGTPVLELSGGGDFEGGATAALELLNEFQAPRTES